MRLSKSTRYALHAALEMTVAGERPVTVSDVAAKYRIPPGALAKVFQSLVRAGVAAGTRGIGGGYRLARSPRRITVLDVVAVFEPPRAEGEGLLRDRSRPPSPDDVRSGLRGLFDEVDEMVRSTFASVTLETLARGGVRDASRPAPSRSPRRAASGS